MRMFMLLLSAAFLAQPAFAETAAAQTKQAENAAPADVLQFYRDYSAAMLSHDMPRIMGFFSDRYLHEGRDKPARKVWMEEWISDLERLDIKITRFTPIDSQRAYVEGRGDDNFVGFTIPSDMQIVKEDGQWKMFGNQKRYDR